ncbi:GGDEF domain-containing protein [Neiella sp. HB171785]|uniref:diguanylate cyclase n=1 Tax=Neiella litorisoli TaxID=2771431 RepID=A0A8J6QTM8_9GAMM|nr:sensor domain-containing diguanylate cyclase [Neiella litorisoli]MBD1388957.1 GGDEF domain-containing protein [Neiella litorisoli]
MSQPKTIGVIIVLSIVINLIVLVSVISTMTSVDDLNQSWQEITQSNSSKAAELIKLERTLGYVGFVHHFKNYIIRRQPTYLNQAVESYEDAQLAISRLLLYAKDEDETRHINAVKNTLNAYYNNLQSIQSLNPDISVEQLDTLVAVDDSRAAAALIALRERLSPYLSAQYQQAQRSATEIHNQLRVASVVIVPILLLISAAFIFQIRKFYKLSRVYQMVLDSSPDGIIYTEFNGDIIHCNKVAQGIFGYSEKELLAMKVEELVPVEYRGDHAKHRHSFSHNGVVKKMGSRDTKLYGLRKTGDYIEIDVAISALNVDNKIRNLAIVRDITKLRHLEHLAETDHLTCLMNRRAIDAVLDREYKHAVRYNRHLAVMLIDLDNFKELNDSEGHLKGDEALKFVAEFLSQNIRPSDYLGRWGGDEFVLVCPELTEKEALEFAERIRERFRQQPKTFDTDLTMSVGISDIGAGNAVKSIRQVTLDADKALYAAKDSGKDCVRTISEIE